MKVKYLKYILKLFLFFCNTESKLNGLRIKVVTTWKIIYNWFFIWTHFENRNGHHQNLCTSTSFLHFIDFHSFSYFCILQHHHYISLNKDTPFYKQSWLLTQASSLFNYLVKFKPKRCVSLYFRKNSVENSGKNIK